MANSGENLGTLRDLVADVSRAQLVYVLISPSKPQPGQIAVVPPQALRTGSAGLALESQKWTGVPMVNERFWTELATPAFAKNVYQHFGIAADRTAGQTATGRSNEELRHAFLEEIVRSKGTSWAALRARNLNIQVNSGRLVLTGTVPNEKDRSELISAGERVAGPGNVEARLNID
jgi:hypothetical protein